MARNEIHLACDSRRQFVIACSFIFICSLPWRCRPHSRAGLDFGATYSWCSADATHQALCCRPHSRARNQRDPNCNRGAGI